MCLTVYIHKKCKEFLDLDILGSQKYRIMRRGNETNSSTGMVWYSDSEVFVDKISVVVAVCSFIALGTI